MEHWKNTSLKNIRGERWIDIKGFEKLYAVSSLGRIKSYEKVRYYKLTDSWQKFTEKIIRPKNVRNGYLGVTLFRFGERIQFTVHRLVATHFVSNPLALPEVNHKKGNRKDNRYFMLEWVTASQNKLHSIYTLRKCHKAKMVMNIKTGKIYYTIKEAVKKTRCKYHPYYVGQMLCGKFINKTNLRFYE